MIKVVALKIHGLSDFASQLKDKEDPRRLNQNIVISLTGTTAQRALYASQNVL